ncbi:cytochrome c oxidase subunit 2 [bacterium A37T11]|nr:cytochrome c oxidase subunit 2 [bacterium A37T11]
MSVKKHNFFRILFCVVLLMGLMIRPGVYAQTTDSTSTSTSATSNVASAGKDTSASAGKDTSAAAAPAAATSAVAPAATSSSTAAAPAEEVKKPIDPQVYINFFYYVLLFFLVCVVIGIIGKILRVYELTSTMQGKKGLNKNSVQGALFLVSLFVGLYGVYWSFEHHGGMAWHEAATEHGKRVDAMFIVTTVITTFVLVVMHIAMFSFAFIYRGKPKAKAYFYPHNNTIEKIWTIVPAIVLTILVLFGFFTWRSITNVPEDLQKSAMQVEVMGAQFQWTIRYAGRDNVVGKRNYKLTSTTNDMGIDFTDKASWDDIQGGEIVLPVNQPVRFHIISKDILHSFYIPYFRVQINAVPGMTNYFQFTPTITTQQMRDKLDDQNFNYTLLCAKICGAGHYNMQKNIRVVSEKEYKAWLAEQTYFYNDDMRKEFKMAQSTNNTNQTVLEGGVK